MCKSFAHQYVYWPGISKDIETEVSKCTVCRKYKRSNIKEPINQYEIPERPWEKLGADIFKFSKHDYLVVLDYHSKYPEFAKLESKTARCCHHEDEDDILKTRNS